jgi:tetratricopeptide (TPR) repeat protein
MSHFSVDQKISKAKAHLKAGNLAASEEIFRSILKKFPGNARALEGVTTLLALKQNQSFSEPAVAQFNAVINLLAEKRFVDAVRETQILLGYFPGAIELYNLLGAAHLGLNQPELAILSYQRALQIKPDYADAIVNLGIAYKDQGRVSDAIECYQKALLINPKSAEPCFNLGKLQADIGDLASAMLNFKRAIALKPGIAMMHAALGNLYLNTGDADEAINCFKTALEINPDFAECYRNYAMAARHQLDSPLVEKVRQLIRSATLPENDRMHLSFALGKIEGDHENHAESMRHYLVGNNLRKKELNYSVASDEALFSDIKNFFSDDQPVVSGPHVGANDARPVFILGMPRSGTTLAEQIVSSHSNVFGAGELGYLGEAISATAWRTSSNRDQIFRQIRADYHEKIRKLSSAPVITDKMPANFRWVGFILNAFPEAKIVSLKRNPAAICWSNFKLYFPARGMGFTFDQQDIARYYLLYHDLMACWHQKFPGRIYDLSYEKLTENQEDETRNLFAYLGLDWEDKVLDFHKSERSVRTASNQQVRKKMYKGSSEEWKKYEPWLGEMLDILKPVL